MHVVILPEGIPCPYLWHKGQLTPLGRLYMRYWPLLTNTTLN